MNIQVNIPVNSANAAIVGQQLEKLFKALDSSSATINNSETLTAKMAKKPAKKAEPETIDEEANLSADTEEGDDLGFEEDEGEDEETETTIDDMVAAFKTFAGKKEGNREKAKSLLTKYKVKSVRDLKPAQFAEVLKLLK